MDGIRQLAVKPKVDTSTSGSQGQNALIEAVILPNGRRLPLIVPDSVAVNPGQPSRILK